MPTVYITWCHETQMQVRMADDVQMTRTIRSVGVDEQWYCPIFGF